MMVHLYTVLIKFIGQDRRWEFKVTKKTKIWAVSGVVDHGWKADLNIGNSEENVAKVVGVTSCAF